MKRCYGQTILHSLGFQIKISTSLVCIWLMMESVSNLKKNEIYTLLSELRKINTLSHSHSTPPKVFGPDVILYLFCNVYYDSPRPLCFQDTLVSLFIDSFLK